VVGVLDKSGSVLDNLILTNIESVWQVHNHTTELDSLTAHDHSPVLGSAFKTGLPNGNEEDEITALLIQFRSAMGAVQLPRIVNSNTNMQAASPAFETQRLFSLLGIGVNMIKSFAYIIIIIAGLSIFISLYNALKDRKYDLAIMRSLGASRSKLFIHVILEGVLITILGGLLGFLLGHSLVEILVSFYEKSEEIGITGMVVVPNEFTVLLLSVSVGIIAALIPALNAYRTDISKVLAQD
jgi:putative ABC transport system permease protein